MSCPLRFASSSSVLVALCLLGGILTAPAFAQPCTISWINAAGGSWSTASNWNLNRTPNGADTVCIQTDATFTVDLDVVATVDSLIVGDDALATTQTLNLREDLTLNSGLSVFGELRVTRSLSLTGDWYNEGTMSVESGLSLDKADGLYRNAGAITTSARLTFNADAHFVHDGSLSGTEAIRVNQSTLTLDGGGNIATGLTTNRGTLLFGSASDSLATSTNDLEVIEGSTLGGTIPVGVSVSVVETTDSSRDAVRLGEGFRNLGQLTLREAFLQGSWINDGTIRVRNGPSIMGGADTLAFVNNGTIDVGNHVLSFTREVTPNGVTTTDPVRFENYGAVTGTGRLTFIRRPSHVINDGRIESGDLELNRATMTLDGSGEISSGMTGFLATLLFGDASAALTTSTAPLQLFEGSTLGGTIPAGVTVEAVRSTDNTNDEIDLRTGFRIGGQFILNSVQVEGGWINDGLLSVVGSSTFLDGTSPSYENNGEVRISGNRTLNVRAGPGSMTPFRNTSTGILSGGGELDIDDGDLVVTNEGRIVPGPLSNVLTISGGIAIPRLDVEVGPAGETNRVDVIGTATLSGLLTITLQSGGALPSGAVTFVTCSAGCTGTFDQIEVTGDAQYAATATYEANAITVEVTEVDPIPPPVLSLSAQTLADDGLQDTDPVGLWPDQSGNGLDAFAPKNRRRPLLRTAVSAFNGQDGVFFNEKRDLRVPPSDSLIDLGPYREKTTALVFRTADVDTRQVLYEQGSDERGQVAYVYQDTLWVGAWNLRGTLWGPLWLSTPISERTVYTLTFSLDANAGQFAAWLNGTSIGSLSGADLLQRARGDGSGLGATTGTTQYEDTGASSAKARMRGFLLEVRQYNAVLSTSARESLEGAFMTTYGISAGARRGVATASSAAPSSAVRSGGTTAVEAMRASASAAPPGGVIDASRTTVAAYPNPFSGAAQIHYHLHRAGEVRVEVYSVLGQRVSVLHDGWLDSGWHQRTLGGRHLPSGLYLVQVTTETDVTTYRITRAR